LTGRIPGKEAAMVLWKVPVLSQTSERRCWEACARMLWKWRYKSLRAYARKAGNWATLDRGLDEEDMNKFYKLLGMRSLGSPRPINLQTRLNTSPIIFTDKDRVRGHAMVLAGFDGSKYTVINPCAIERVDFGDEGTGSDAVACQAKIMRGYDRSAVEGPLGNYIWYW
jgi:ABC-type bacteriocin/lantibiotic exporter with double-glycine peptidase domain